eukprot:CAMPEP_0202450414 /NCGR_PEP_ID=MMETSP1360-20130828/9021_1 /ASSEMBLY_ACC=CAM_ASM_000848 /TAXON_ID=515479 /ORGANISM="Licmophora paradoxa, Strain CCMP2313" /LENGTH=42 /DNA_ID= /DNA_START= /DNA_END= /DNA_ORIENTATION=
MLQLLEDYQPIVKNITLATIGHTSNHNHSNDAKLQIKNAIGG